MCVRAAAQRSATSAATSAPRRPSSATRSRWSTLPAVSNTAVASFVPPRFIAMTVIGAARSARRPTIHPLEPPVEHGVGLEPPLLGAAVSDLELPVGDASHDRVGERFERLAHR